MGNAGTEKGSDHMKTVISSMRKDMALHQWVVYVYAFHCSVCMYL